MDIRIKRWKHFNIHSVFRKLSGHFIVWCSLRFCRMQHKGQSLYTWPFQSILMLYISIHLSYTFYRMKHVGVIVHICCIIAKRKVIVYKFHFFSAKQLIINVPQRLDLRTKICHFLHVLGILFVFHLPRKKSSICIKRYLAILYHDI